MVIGRTDSDVEQLEVYCRRAPKSTKMAEKSRVLHKSCALTGLATALPAVLTRMRAATVVLAAALGVLPMLPTAALGNGSPVTAEQQTPAKRPDAPHLAPYVPTPQEVVDRMLQLGQVRKTDVVYDLGCGDGRIPITAAKRLARAASASTSIRSASPKPMPTPRKTAFRISSPSSCRTR
jgi:hypothetical protein